MPSDADDRALSVDDLVSAFTSKPLEVQLRRDQDSGNFFSGTGYLLSAEGGLKQAVFKANIDDGVIRFSMDGILLGTDRSAVSEGQDRLFLTYQLDRGIQFLGVSFESHAVGLHHLLGSPGAQQGLLSPPASLVLPGAEPAAGPAAEAETVKGSQESFLERTITEYQAEFNHRLLGHAISGGLVRGNMVAVGLHPRHYEDLVTVPDAASSLLWDEAAVGRAYELLPQALLHRDKRAGKQGVGKQGAGKQGPDNDNAVCIHPMTLAFLAHPSISQRVGFQDYAYQLIERSLQPVDAFDAFPALQSDPAIAKLVHGFLKAMDDEEQRKELLRALGYLDEDGVRSLLTNAGTGADGYQALGHLQPHATLGMVHQELVASWIDAYQATKDVEQARAALPARLPEQTPAPERPLHRPFQVIHGGTAEQSAASPPPTQLHGHPDLDKILAAEEDAIAPEVVGRVPPNALPISQLQQRPEQYDPDRVVSQVWVVYRALQEIGAPIVIGGNGDTEKDDYSAADYSAARSLIFEENAPTPVRKEGRAAYYKVGDFTDEHFKELKKTVGARKGFTARDILTDKNVRAWDPDSVVSQKEIAVMLGLGPGSMKKKVASAGVKPVNNNPHLKLYRVGDVHEALGLPGWLAEESHASFQDQQAQRAPHYQAGAPVLPTPLVLPAPTLSAEAPSFPLPSSSPAPLIEPPSLPAGTALATIDTLVDGSAGAPAVRSDSHSLQNPPLQEARASEVTLWWVAYQLGISPSDRKGVAQVEQLVFNRHSIDPSRRFKKAAFYDKSVFTDEHFAGWNAQHGTTAAAADIIHNNPYERAWHPDDLISSADVARQKGVGLPTAGVLLQGETVVRKDGKFYLYRRGAVHTKLRMPGWLDEKAARTRYVQDGEPSGDELRRGEPSPPEASASPESLDAVVRETAHEESASGSKGAPTAVYEYHGETGEAAINHFVAAYQKTYQERFIEKLIRECIVQKDTVVVGDKKMPYHGPITLSRVAELFGTSAKSVGRRINNFPGSALRHVGTELAIMPLAALMLYIPITNKQPDELVQPDDIKKHFLLSSDDGDAIRYLTQAGLMAGGAIPYRTFCAIYNHLAAGWAATASNDPNSALSSTTSAEVRRSEDTLPRSNPVPVVSAPAASIPAVAGPPSPAPAAQSLEAVVHASEELAAVDASTAGAADGALAPSASPVYDLHYDSESHAEVIGKVIMAYQATFNNRHLAAGVADGSFKYAGVRTGTTVTRYSNKMSIDMVAKAYDETRKDVKDLFFKLPKEMVEATEDGARISPFTAVALFPPELADHGFPVPFADVRLLLHLSQDDQGLVEYMRHAGVIRHQGRTDSMMMNHGDYATLYQMLFINFAKIMGGGDSRKAFLRPHGYMPKDEAELQLAAAGVPADKTRFTINDALLHHTLFDHVKRDAVEKYVVELRKP